MQCQSRSRITGVYAGKQQVKFSRRGFPFLALVVGVTSVCGIVHACPPGDVNGDDHLDLLDYAVWPDCLTGPNDGPPGNGCSATVDSDFDQDVDLFDWRKFQSIFGEVFSGDLFPDPQRYPVGESPRSIVVADLDGDTDMDLAVANRNSGAVSVLLNNNNGTFAQHVPYDTGTLPISVTAADLDGDGDIDLATANRLFSGTVSVLRNHGDGTFAAHVTFAAGPFPTFVTAANLDGENGLDLAVTNDSSDTVSVLLNNGDGTFAARVPYGTGNQPISVAAADLDGDNHLDLTVANISPMENESTVSVLLNNGDGTFADQVPYGTGSGPRSVAVADLDGDFDLDLAVANRGPLGNGDTVSVLLNDGNGTFAPHVTYGTGPFPIFVIAADLDGDNDLDLITAEEGILNGGTTVSVLLNHGDATYAARLEYEVGTVPVSVAAGDLDSDNDLDLAVANADTAVNTVSVLLNRCVPND